MEVIIILVIVGIIGYIFFQSFPAPKYQRAVQLLDDGQLNKAAEILTSIFEKHPEAPAKLAECKLLEGQKVKSESINAAIQSFNEVFEIKTRIPNHFTKTSYELIEAKTFFEIAEIQFDQANTDKGIDNKIKSIKDSLCFIDSAVKTGIESDFLELKNRHLYELAGLYYQLGEQCEKLAQYVEAMQHYVLSIDCSSQSACPKILYNSYTRLGICKLKNNVDVDKDELINVMNSSTEYRKDFFYRYAIWLLQNNDYSEAEKIIETHLNFSSHAIEKLNKWVRREKINNAICRINQINATIEHLYANDFPVDDVETLYDSLDNIILELSPVIPAVTNSLKALRPSLFNKLLSHYISNEMYGKATNKIVMYPYFWESPELLKNLGICNFRYAAQGKLIEKNFRLAVSSWLTAVFSDKVILNSLEATCWDDNYTFTLVEAIGSNFSQHEKIPDNANYDEVSDSNISIGATQRELLLQFESILRSAVKDTELYEIINNFYTKEKEAIERIVLVIEEDILFASPFFALLFGLDDKIVECLDADYKEYSQEESLAAGIPYLNGDIGIYVREYARAKDLVSKIVLAIETEKLKDLTSIIADPNIALIEKYDTISDAVEDLVFYAFSYKIEENDQNENLIPLMDECIQFFSSNEKLKTQCSSFINNYCDSNWTAKRAVKLLELMVKSIKYNPNCYKTAKTITILINNNLMDIANDATYSTQQIYSLINEVKKIRSEVLKDELKELLVLREKLLESLGRKVAITILFDPNLNPNGMKLRKVINTMQDVGGGSTI